MLQISIKRVFVKLFLLSLKSLYKVTKIKIYLIYTFKIGHLALNNDLFFRRLRAGYFGQNKFILVGPKKNSHSLIANNTLYRLIRREAIKNSKIIFIESSFIYVLLNKLQQSLRDYGVDISLPMDSNESEFSLYEKIFDFTESEKGRGWLEVEKLGIPHNKRIVCMFARDSSFYVSKDNSVDWTYHDYRNAEIDTYIPAIDHLISLGYFVIRIGSLSSKPVNYSNKFFLDYSFSKLRSDFLDIFLIRISEFIVGTTSGITDVATIFNIPFLGVNYAPFIECPLGKKDRFIQKKLKNRLGEVVNFKDIFKLGIDDAYNGVSYLERTGLAYIDNTEEEVLDAVIEMESIVNGSYIENDEDKILTDEYFSKYWTEHNYLKRGELKIPLCNFWLKKFKGLYI